LFLVVAMLFINNIKVKGLYTNYNKKLKLPGICQFVFKHLQNLNKALNRIKQAKTSMGLKSQFYYNSISIISFIYSFRERSLTIAKVNKILN